MGNRISLNLSKTVLAYAIIIGLAVASFFGCDKKKTALSENAPQTHAAANNMRTTNCINPYDWTGVNHNMALSAAMASNPKPTNLDTMLQLAKLHTLPLTQYVCEQAVINDYPKSKLIASSKLAKALISNDDSTIAQYCTPEEAILLKKLFAIANEDMEISVALDEVKDWACGIQTDATIANDLKNKMLVTSSVMTKSIEYWHGVYGGTTGRFLPWFGGDAVGAFMGFTMGGAWGAVVGAVAGSILVGCFGWEITIP